MAMPRRIVECGRVEVKGAVVRFKEKRTLESQDRNLSAVERVRVRATPSPELRVFADFHFEGAVFRLWQDATLVNYSDFLPSVAATASENFRAFLRHATQAAPDRLDSSSAAFAAGTAAAERFPNRDAMASHDRAITRVAPAASVPAPEQGGARAVEEAWKELSPALAEEPPLGTFVPRLAGMTLLLFGLLTGMFAARALMHVLSLRLDDDRSPFALVGVIAGGAVAALAFMILGVIFLRRNGPPR